MSRQTLRLVISALSREGASLRNDVRQANERVLSLEQEVSQVSERLRLALELEQNTFSLMESYRRLYHIYLEELSDVEVLLQEARNMSVNRI